MLPLLSGVGGLRLRAAAFLVFGDAGVIAMVSVTDAHEMYRFLHFVVIYSYFYSLLKKKTQPFSLTSNMTQAQKLSIRKKSDQYIQNISSNSREQFIPLKSKSQASASLTTVRACLFHAIQDFHLQK